MYQPVHGWAMLFCDPASACMRKCMSPELASAKTAFQCSGFLHGQCKCIEVRSATIPITVLPCSLKTKLGQAVTVLRMYHHKVRAKSLVALSAQVHKLHSTPCTHILLPICMYLSTNMTAKCLVVGTRIGCCSQGHADRNLCEGCCGSAAAGCTTTAAASGCWGCGC